MPQSLYGGNGVGKSTLLRLVFHLLSAAHKRGHRTALYKTDFHYLEVALSSGIRLAARVLAAVGKEDEEEIVTAAEMLIQRGMEKGLEKGREQGREEGLEQGERKLLLKQLRAKFGTLSEATLRSVDASMQPARPKSIDGASAC